MSVNHAWLLKGWLLGEPNVPDEITEAVNAIIASLARSDEIVITGTAPAFPVIVEVEEERESESSTQPAGDSPAPKKRKEWSPEAKAAASERMRARQAAGLMGKRKSEPVTPGEARAPSPGGA